MAIPTVPILIRLGKYSKQYGGRHYSVDWTTGLDYWTGLLDSRKMPSEGKITGL